MLFDMQNPTSATYAPRARRRARRAAAGNLYSPGGCGCALLMAPVMALSVGIALMLMVLGVVETIEQVLGLYANIAIAWIGAMVADLVINNPCCTC